MSNKPQSLASKSGALSGGGLQLPSVFQAAVTPVKARSFPPYIVFSHPKRADEWAKISAKYGAVAEGTMVLVRDGGVLKLDTAKIGWLCHRQYWAHSNAAGNELIAASFEEQPKPFKEHVEAVVLLYLPDEIVVCNMQFRSTKCPAAKVMSDALLEASSLEWANKSPQHKESMVCAQPFMRFYGDVRLADKRTAKESGLPYVPTACEVRPTGVPEWRLLKALCDNPTTQKAMDDAAERFTHRIAEVQKKVAG